MVFEFKQSAARSFLVALVVVPMSAAHADLNDEAVDRCMLEVGEFGSAMVQTCVEHDVAAAKALATYPRSARETVARCTDVHKPRGWSVIKMCVDREMEADAAVDAYAKKNAAVVQKCQERLGSQGAVKVKECVEQEVGGQ
jgi:hypothetical protein